jgi:hypothetical protein
MASSKPELAVVSLTEEPKADIFDHNEENDFDGSATVSAKYRGNAHDKSEMRMMGKKQVLRVCVVSKPDSLSCPLPARRLSSRPIDLCSEILSFSRCWALQVPSWLAGRFYFREYARHSISMDDLNCD